MRVAVITIFPEIFGSFLNTSIIKKALHAGRLSLDLVSPRSFAAPPHFQIDDVPYGGGPGMVFKPEPLVEAVRHVRKRLPQSKITYLTPTGIPLTQKKAVELSTRLELIFLCGRYEGIDQRVVDLEVDEEISLGDFVLMGGEVAAMAVLEAAIRLVPGILGNEESIAHESFSAHNPFLEAPCYTRPAEFERLQVPEVLLSGNHQEILQWKKAQSLTITQAKRPDLILAESEQSAEKG